MAAARGEGRGAAWCHLLVTSDGLGGPPQRKAVGEMLYSRGERGCSWPWPAGSASCQLWPLFPRRVHQTPGEVENSQRGLGATQGTG